MAKRNAELLGGLAQVGAVGAPAPIPTSHTPQSTPSLLEKQQRFKWYLLLVQFFARRSPYLR